MPNIILECTTTNLNRRNTIWKRPSTGSIKLQKIGYADAVPLLKEIEQEEKETK